jgi:hypothetical protein
MRMRVMLAAATCAACATDGTNTGPATLTVDGTQIAMAAVMYPSQTIALNGDSFYRGWTVAFVTDPPGACPDPMSTTTEGWVAFLTGQLESSPNDVVIAPGEFPIVRNVPNPITETVAAVTIVVTAIGLESGSAAITVFDPGARMEGTLTGVGMDTATNATVNVSGTFTAYACPSW